jgi:predicted membrane-bound dolichyl-phosphate-mannose-protein mannosyltransferase
VQNIREHSLVDVRDVNYIWNAGIVNSIVTLKNQEKYAFIEYIGLDEIYNEYINIDSDRLASFGFYTNREELPKYIKLDENVYILGLNENNNEAQLVEDSDEHISEIIFEYPYDDENDITNYINALRG